MDSAAWRTAAIVFGLGGEASCRGAQQGPLWCFRPLSVWRPCMDSTMSIELIYIMYKIIYTTISIELIYIIYKIIYIYILPGSTQRLVFYNLDIPTWGRNLMLFVTSKLEAWNSTRVISNRSSTEPVRTRPCRRAGLVVHLPPRCP